MLTSPDFTYHDKRAGTDSHFPRFGIADLVVEHACQTEGAGVIECAL